MSETTVSKLLKALYSAGMSLLGALATVLGDDAHLTSLTAGQWVTIAAFTLGAFGGTYGLAGWAGPSVGKNDPPPPGG